MIKCGIKGCERDALIAYGGMFICGECMAKIIKKQKENQIKQIKELEEELK